MWALRKIDRSRDRAGRRMNLLAKRRATLEFLHVHHEDLKHAIALAGPNRTNAQETWHRVFRDAERAVLRQTPDAFPELDEAARPRCGASCSGTAAGSVGLRPGAARAGPAAAAGRRPGRAVRVRLQPVPRVDEPRRRLGARARA